MGCWGKEQQVCATCRYWFGRRKVDYEAVFFETKESYGVCAGPDGSFRGLQMYEGGSCPKWEKFRD